LDVTSSLKIWTAAHHWHIYSHLAQVGQLVVAGLPHCAQDWVTDETTRPSPLPHLQCWRRPLTRCSRFTTLHDSQDPRLAPALRMPSPVRRGSLPRPRCRPRRRGSGAGAATPARPPAPAASNDEKASDLIMVGGGDDQALSPGAATRLQDFSPLLSSAKLA
jgi:hypothetical protein